MSKDSEILEELWKEIGKPLPQLEPDKIGKLLKPCYAVDENGYVLGVNLHEIENLKTILIILLKFEHLKKLSFFKVKIRDFSLLDKLSNLISLTILGIPIDNISFLQGLSNLTTLVLINNKLTDISFLQGLSNLKELNLSLNQLTDISVLQGLSNLKELKLSYNQLTDISVLQGLKSLTFLDLRFNKIKKLPEAIVDLGMEIDLGEIFGGEKGIFLYDNPLESPPPEIIRKGKKAIKAYFKSLEKGKLPLNEVKVLLVGDGGAGKTSLVKRLVGERFNKKEPQTHGININQWEIKQQKIPIKTHLWDFGGQEIMHATHQFFLSKRSLYILVLDGRKDEKTEYWLKHIRSFGGDSPVLVVLNKIDENPGFEVNRRFLQDKYKNIKGFFRLSCADNIGIDEFTKALKKALCDVEIIRTTWAENWFHVKEHLETMEEPFISLERYKEICLEEKIEEKSGQDTLVDFLHDLGIILHFEDLGLQDVHVLEPKWVTEAVYKIINAPMVAQNKGILKPAFLDEILKQKNRSDYYYPSDRYHYIIELMKKFELCYQLEKGEVLIPDLLDVEESEFEFDYDNSLKFLFEYDFLPRSVMPRFIVRMHNDIKENCRWRTGVLLENTAFDARAVVKADNEAKKIYIYVSGQQKQYYFAVIRFTFKDINRSFEKLDVKEYVPIPEDPNITVSYSYLLQLREMNLKEYIPEGIKKPYSIDGLLDGFEENENSRIAVNINKRWAVLDECDKMIFNTKTREAEIHKLLEDNLWVLGNEYPKIASNATLKKTLEEYFRQTYTGDKGEKRPDLLLAQDMKRRYLLIELKRPSHKLNRDDEFQAVKYRDDINRQIPDIKIDIILIGGGIKEDISLHNASPDVKFLTFKSIINNARNNLKWLIEDLDRGNGA
jgi:small GTP-binding protein